MSRLNLIDGCGQVGVVSIAGGYLLIWDVYV